MKKKRDARHTEPRHGRRIFQFLIVVFCIFLATEIGARFIFASKVGPRVLVYGTPWNRTTLQQSPPEQTVAVHDNSMGDYTKYFPNEVKRDHDPVTGEEFNVAINSHGFRGKEFRIEKAPNTIRIVTLGASSTFGFNDRDDETYPHYLEEILNERDYPGTRFEVINLGIPHLVSDRIRALFEAEGLPLDPDVVTFYEGANDSISMQAREQNRRYAEANAQSFRTRIASIDVIRSVYRAIRDSVILVGLADTLMQSQRLWLVTEADYANHLVGKKERFLENISAINEMCRERGILFIPVKQQMQSLIFPDIRGLTYEEEVDLVSARLAEGLPIGREGLGMLTHKILIDGLEEWAAANDVAVVDAIDATNERRDLLTTWVHLRPEANAMIAEEIAKEIERQLADTLSERAIGSAEAARN